MFFCELGTDRLFLKNIGKTDGEFILSQFSDPEITRYLFDAEPLKTLNEADEIIDFYLQPEPRNQHRWILTDKQTGILIGTCGFHYWNKDQSTVEIGYDLKVAFQGKGYMNEALRAIIEFAKNRMKVKTINACVYIKNAPSIRTVEKLGFIKSSSKNEHFRGEDYPHHIYTLTL